MVPLSQRLFGVREPLHLQQQTRKVVQQVGVLLVLQTLLVKPNAAQRWIRDHSQTTCATSYRQLFGVSMRMCALYVEILDVCLGRHMCE